MVKHDPVAFMQVKKENKGCLSVSEDVSKGVVGKSTAPLLICQGKEKI